MYGESRRRQRRTRSKHDRRIDSNPQRHSIRPFDRSRLEARVVARFASDGRALVRGEAALWKRNNIWISVDKAGFNPPETARWKFPGPRLHWDVSLVPRVPFGMQGILYLTDTAADQGAFSCVPGFHHKLNDWLRSLPPEVDPRKQNLDSLVALPIAGRAGDLIVWRQELPHGSSPNRASKPRIVHYISGHPSEAGGQSRVAVT